jgi:hypothetical protein
MVNLNLSIVRSVAKSVDLKYKPTPLYSLEE